MLKSDDELRRRAGELFRAWTLAEITGHNAESLLTLGDLVAFLIEGRPLSGEQQSFLFSNPRLRSDFKRLIEVFGHALPSAGRPILRMPALAAAASDREVNDRVFEGATVRIRPSIIGQQFFVQLTMEDPKASPSSLVIELPEENLTASSVLEPPDGEGRILMIKDIADKDDGLFVRLLRDPRSTGTFLK